MTLRATRPAAWLAIVFVNFASAGIAKAASVLDWAALPNQVVSLSPDRKSYIAQYHDSSRSVLTHVSPAQQKAHILLAVEGNTEFSVQWADADTLLIAYKASFADLGDREVPMLHALSLSKTIKRFNRLYRTKSNVLSERITTGTFVQSQKSFINETLVWFLREDRFDRHSKALEITLAIEGKEVRHRYWAPEENILQFEDYPNEVLLNAGMRFQSWFLTKDQQGLAAFQVNSEQLDASQVTRIETVIKDVTLSTSLSVAGVSSTNELTFLYLDQEGLHQLATELTHIQPITFDSRDRLYFTAYSEQGNAGLYRTSENHQSIHGPLIEANLAETMQVKHADHSVFGLVKQPSAKEIFLEQNYRQMVFAVQKQFPDHSIDVIQYDSTDQFWLLKLQNHIGEIHYYQLSQSTRELMPLESARPWINHSTPPTLQPSAPVITLDLAEPGTPLKGVSRTVLHAMLALNGIQLRNHSIPSEPDTTQTRCVWITKPLGNPENVHCVIVSDHSLLPETINTDSGKQILVINRYDKTIPGGELPYENTSSDNIRILSGSASSWWSETEQQRIDLVASIATFVHDTHNSTQKP